jgi:hypothetical protein
VVNLEDEIRRENATNRPKDQEAAIDNGAPHKKRRQSLNIHNVVLSF